MYYPLFLGQRGGIANSRRLAEDGVHIWWRGIYKQIVLISKCLNGVSSFMVFLCLQLVDFGVWTSQDMLFNATPALNAHKAKFCGKDKSKTWIG